jgi:hypothetical protein
MNWWNEIEFPPGVTDQGALTRSVSKIARNGHQTKQIP